MKCVEMQHPAADPLAGIRSLERGDILVFPNTPLDIPDGQLQALLNTGQADGNFHKNISYRPTQDRISGVGKTVPGELEKVQNALRNYSRAAMDLLRRVLPAYESKWKTDYTSFRSIEEEGRDLPWKKRNDLLHTDAFPTRPTNGGLILRVFTNINPEKERVWVTSEPFAALAPKYADAAGLQEVASTPANSFSGWIKDIARGAGLPIIRRSRYDEFMLRFHDFLKSNAAYQRDCPKYRFSFPPNSTWMVFTDVVPHSVLSGRFALEQTMIVSHESLLQPECAPVAILEKLSGKRLTL